MLELLTLASTIPHARAWELTDTRSRSRLTFTLSREPAETMSDWHAASLLMLLVCHLGGSTPDDVDLKRIEQPLGTPTVDLITRYDIIVNKEPVVATITIKGEFDAALDGDAISWQTEVPNKYSVYPAAAQLAYHMSTTRPE